MPEPEDDPLRSVDIARPGRRDLVAEAMRRRIRARLFGESDVEVRIGRFRVVETLGQGGMGTVYAADDAQLERRVALKVIRDDRLREGSRDRARLLREARLQAKLSDPHVVQIHEVSEYERGLFIVMELVRGPTLRQWLEREVRPLPALLERFIEAARGLAAAHRAGIVHRDFKLSNALVGEDGRVRLVDFGLALGCAAHPDSTTEGTVPVAGSASDPTPSGTRRVGTPIYMSPEQVLGAECDARSDQYSFSVALAEALYGRPPASAKERLSHKPSIVLPADRKVPRWLRDALTRGLALRPEERFPSMQAMIDVLVEAPRRRRRWLAGAGVALALTAATAVGASFDGGHLAQCPDAREHLAGLWDDDRRDELLAAFTATRLGFAEGSWRRTTAALDDYAARWAAARRDNCEATRVRGEQSERAFDRSAHCLDRARASWATLLAALAAADVAIVAHAEALVAGLPAPEECRAPALQRTDADDRAGDRHLAEREAMLERARILVRTSQGSRAAALLTDGLTQLRTAGDQAGEAEALLWLGKTQAELLSDGTGAVRSLHLAYDRALVAGRTDLTWEIWAELAYVHARVLAAPAEARLWLAHADSARPRASPIAEAALLAIEAEILAAEGRYEDAIGPRQAALARLQAHHPAGHPDITRARMSLAAGLGNTDRVVESREHYTRLFAELAAQYGPDHPWPAKAELDLGLDLLELEQYAQARVHLEHARRVIVATYGPVHRSIATIDLGLAQVDAAEGNLEQAIVRGEQALAGYDETLPRAHASRVTALTVLSALYLASAQIEPQLRVSRELLAIHDLVDGRGNFDLPGLLTNVGNCLCDLGRCGEALPYFTRLTALYTEQPPDDPTFAAAPLRGIGLVHAARGEPALALVFLEQAHEQLAGAHERDGIAELRAATARELADVLAALGRAPERVKQLRRQAAALAPRDAE